MTVIPKKGREIEYFFVNIITFVQYMLRNAQHIEP